ncbi:MAG: fused MFS/spermidine synthase [Planctomycetota bacterium]|nr:fused MFS/spermidine synthase [Planctomycetota bacterium]
MNSGILILFNAFLLFLIQPILGKSLLPKWGGTAHVWTTCLLFFQTALLAGYVYAWKIDKKTSLSSHATVHASLWAISVILMPILAWWPADIPELTPYPTLSILLELTLRIGLPFLLMASTSSLLSTWHFRTSHTQHPYAWYALANLSSLAACLLYPIAIEPSIASSSQQVLWMILYGMLAIGMILHSLKVAHLAKDLPAGEVVTPLANQSKHPWLCLCLSACTSIVLAATTSHASQAGMIVPGLWVLPLAVYLASWYLAFWHPIFQSWSSQMGLFYLGSLCGLGAVVFKLWLPWYGLVACCLAAVACIGLACHGLIYRLRPAAESMSSFYLRIALGGAIGSLFASVIAPRCMNDYYELHAAIALGALALAWFHSQDLYPKLFNDPMTRRFSWPLTILCPTLLLAALSMLLVTPSLETCIDKKRDFYGVVTVIENQKQGLRAMLHGRIRHGTQPLDGILHPNQTTYYQTDSGAALAFGWCHNHFSKPLNVAVLGLGTGSLSLYANAQDSMRYYEISPAVCQLAEKHFLYLSSHRGSTEILVGDGRQLLEREILKPDQPAYHLIVVDAFSNDSLPIHLLTTQALALYKQRLAPDGILALNITNRNLDLAPILFATAQQAALKPLLVESKLSPFEPESRQVRWLLLFPLDATLPAWPGARDQLAPSNQPSEKTASNRPVWTDDFASPLHAMRW